MLGAESPDAASTPDLFYCAMRGTESPDGACCLIDTCLSLDCGPGGGRPEWVATPGLRDCGTSAWCLGTAGPRDRGNPSSEPERRNSEPTLVPAWCEASYRQIRKFDGCFPMCHITDAIVLRTLRPLPILLRLLPLLPTTLTCRLVLRRRRRLPTLQTMVQKRRGGITL